MGRGDCFVFPKKVRYFDNPDAVECAELLVKAVHEVTGVRITEQTTGDISPQDLWVSPWLKEFLHSIK
ncbi:hypothetical protein PAECIP111891_02199 [Paenibacillus allorhizoplanae]|uniref:Uncharacterized protein n=1 Tax=Paenibacillus allorhizoplanae TaxID=2905648 RepID=A0ABM9C4I9_9BACL|nr:hypothetical protein PAECIP111891_02199 [Paenibacillus allorhizoplanae]